ncbi:uncharacterized protein [Lepeophtheirus salmonis]|uniref:uncharacterized protein isoform X2 n=1 Tax=Lepeophtheirus salmonis TaxID=72036 RepID=UPI001AE367AD|nr:homeobox protein onecut-like isoform X2 [Lepeophtheirus salmonis]
MMSLEVDHSGLIKSEEERMSSPVVEEEEEEEEEEQEEEEEEEEQEEDSSIDKLVYGGSHAHASQENLGVRRVLRERSLTAMVHHGNNDDDVEEEGKNEGEGGKKGKKKKKERGGGRIIVSAAHLVAAATAGNSDSPAKILLVRSSSHRGSHQHSHSSSSSSLAQIIASSSASSSTQPNKSSHSASLSAPSSVVAATASNAAQHEEETPTLIEEDGTITVTVGSSESNMIDASDFHRSMESGSYGGPHHLGRGGSPPSQSCYGSASSYATLTPLQPLPPISSIPSMQDKFQAYSPGGSSASGNGVQGNNNVNPFVMQNHAHLSSLGSPYHSYDTKLPPIGMSPPPHSHFHSMGTMGHHSPGALSPDGGSNPEYSQNGGLTHSKREPLSPSHYYDTGRHPSPQDLSPSSLDHSPPSHATQNMYSPHLSSTANPGLNGMVSPGALSPHTSPGGSALSSGLRDLSPPPPTSNHAIITPVPMPNSHPDGPSSNANIMMSNLKTSPPSHNNNNSSTNPAAPSASASNSNSHSSSSSSSNASGETEEINTKDLAQRISAELKRYSIPQAIFAQRVLCRSQGTLSDLLRNPKPWSKLKSGRETFRRMQKWLSEPEFQRMSALRLAVMQQSATEKERGRSAVCKRKEDSSPEQSPAPKKPRLVFTDLQRRTLQAIFKETKRPTKEIQVSIARQLGLQPTTVGNFFMNARRRLHDKWSSEMEDGSHFEDTEDPSTIIKSGRCSMSKFVNSSNNISGQQLLLPLESSNNNNTNESNSSNNNENCFLSSSSSVTNHHSHQQQQQQHHHHRHHHHQDYHASSDSMLHPCGDRDVSNNGGSGKQGLESLHSDLLVDDPLCDFPPLQEQQQQHIFHQPQQQTQPLHLHPSSHTHTYNVHSQPTSESILHSHTPHDGIYSLTSL